MKTTSDPGTTNSSSKINSFSSSNANGKYAGLIEVPVMKKIRNSLLLLFDYVSTITPPMHAMHSFITCWRIMQLIGPSLMANFHELWGNGSIMDIFLSYFSIIYAILPSMSRPKASPYLLLAYGIIMIIYIIFVCVSANKFSKTQKLPQWVAMTISIFTSTFCYIASNAVVANAGGLLGAMIHFSNEYATPLNIVSLVLGAVTFFAWVYLISVIYLASITFKADSMLSVYPSTSIFVTHITYVITFLLAIVGPIAYDPVRKAIGILSIIIYIVSTPLIFSRGGFVSSTIQKIVGSVFISSALNIIIFMILESQKIQPKEYMIIIFITIVAGVYFILSYVIVGYFNKSLRILDQIQECSDNFDMIKTPNMLANVSIVGYRFAHPTCMDFSIFKMATNRWPGNQIIWVLFAKFTAIYPEINQQLYFIAISVKKNKIKGGLAKQCLSQLHFIMSQREGNLVGSLKAKLDKINKDLQQAKHKIRYMWDLVIQGNENELEAAVDKVKTSIETVEVEFLQVLRQYPNNRFVARAYSRYLRDVSADYYEYKRWNQNCSLLTRGIKINPDTAHELGIKAFPSLPQNVVSIDTSGNAIVEESAESFEQSIEDNEQMTGDIEVRLAIRESINNLKIPGFFLAKLLTALNIGIFFGAYLVAFTVYLTIYLEDIKPPLNFLYVTSSMRTRMCQVLAFAHRYIIEKITVTGNGGEAIFPVPDYTLIIRAGIPAPGSIGASWETNEQLVYIMTELIALEEQLKDLMTFHTTDENMKRVINGIYGNTIDFTFYSDPIFSPDDINPTSVTFNTTKKSMNLMQTAAEYVLQGLALTSKTTLTPNDYQGRFITQTFKSVYNVENCVLDLSEHIIFYIKSVQDNIDNIVRICMIVFPIAFFLIHLGIMIFNIRKIHNDKHLIYKAIISLPKNVVSKVTDQFKVLKKDSENDSHSKSHDDDYNRQEENMLKTFATSGEKGRSQTADLMSVVLCTIFQMIFHVVTSILVLMLMKQLIHMIAQAAPHINYITGTYSTDVVTLASVTALLGYKHPTNLFQIPFTLEENYVRIEDYTKQLSKFFQAVRYGNPETNDVPFASLGIKIDSESTKGYCSDDTFPNTAPEIFSCSNSDALLSFCQCVDKSMKNLWQYGNTTFTPADPQHKYLWHIHLYHVFNDYFFPMFETIMSQCYEALDKQFPIYLATSYTLFVLAVLVELLYISAIVSSEKRQIYALKFLLHCPGAALIANKNIVSILQGDFSQKSIDTTTRDSDFYDIVVKDMPDSIIVLGIDGKIYQSNRATEIIFGINNNELIEKHISEFGKSFKENPFEKIENCEKKLSFMRDDVIVHIEITILVEQDYSIITTREVTQKVMYNQLISDEKKKSDHLLSSILPASLVARVQAGEKNISFAIQTVSILFMDIVSFTPWCGSLPASKVMATLNRLFKEFDASVSHHSTITKIKCIGDCYMAAGGIFAETNQPAIHAKDTVDFGLDALEAIEKVNEEIGEKLQMRIGINTGGPIVAGVLGTAKPTFEIIGPAINMAQQMEHHGVPMRVHISRSVYELIYGGNYIIKERGEIEIKNGKVITYLVESKK